MARARFLRPEFFTDEKVSDLSFGTCILFQGIWCQADLRGVFEHSPRLLRGLIFPMRDGIDTATIGDWLNVLERSGLIRRFESDGKSWGVVNNWNRHQEISTREIEIGSRRPKPPDWAEPERWSEIVEKARKSGRIASSSEWNVLERSGTVLEQTQNPTATATATATATPTPPADNPRLMAVAAAGGYLDFKDQDLRPDWLVAIGDHPIQQIVDVMAYGRRVSQKPVRMPSAYCEHAKAMANAHRATIAKLRAQAEATELRHRERAETDEKTKQSEAITARNRATVGGILATYDEDPARWAPELTERQAKLLNDLRTAYDARRPIGLLAFHLDGLPRALGEMGAARGREITEQTEIAV